MVYLVRLVGIEPTAFPFGGERSIHWATGARSPFWAILSVRFAVM